MLKTQALAKKIKKMNKVSNNYMLISVLSGIATTFLSVWLLNLFIRDIATKQNIALIVFGICLMQLIKALFYAMGIWQAHNAAYQSLTDIRLEIIDHLKQLPLSFFQRRRVGELTNIISHDVEQIEIYLAHAQPEIIITKMIPVLAAISLFFIDWRLGLVLILPFPFMLALKRLTKKLWRNNFKRYAKSTKEMTEDLLEYTSGMTAIKAFSTDEQKTETIILRINTYVDWIKKIMYTLSVPMSFTKMILEIGFILLVIVGANLIIDGQLTIIELILGIVLARLFPSSLIKLMTFNHTEIVLGRSVTSINSILGEELYPIYSYKGNIDAGDIELKNVNFSYDGDEAVLKDIDITFKENAVTAIVGSSGSGKSTIANLIMGFWRTSQGSITIGGNDIDKMNEKDLSKIVSIVQQEVFLYNASIAENIRIGRGDASLDEIMEAAKKARIHDMVISLPNGYDTIVGESGSKLSGGEKQRISLARIILKNAPIIILDEATAAIDPYNEHLIQEAINNLSKNKTLIVISHHLNTIVNADKIVVMDKGCVVASGKHHDLLATCSMYSDMINAQNEVDHWEIRQGKEVLA